MTLQRRAGTADRHHLGMRGGIVAQIHLVIALGQHAAVAHDDAADRVGAGAHIGAPRQLQRVVHPVQIVVGWRHARPSRV